VKQSGCKGASSIVGHYVFILTAMTKQQLLETVTAATGQSKSEIDCTLEAILEKTSEASDTPRKAGGLMSWAASKAVDPWV
jgi:formylmethanofuran:tetrahydromethanopterin formyltransferase